MGGRRQWVQNLSQGLKGDDPILFSPILSSFSVVTGTCSHGFLLKCPETHRVRDVSPGPGREVEKQDWYRRKNMLTYKQQSGWETIPWAFDKVKRKKKQAHQSDCCENLLLTRQMEAEADDTLLTQTTLWKKW